MLNVIDRKNFIFSLNVIDGKNLIFHLIFLEIVFIYKCLAIECLRKLNVEQKIGDKRNDIRT